MARIQGPCSERPAPFLRADVSLSPDNRSRGYALCSCPRAGCDQSSRYASVASLGKAEHSMCVSIEAVRSSVSPAVPSCPPSCHSLGSGPPRLPTPSPIGNQRPSPLPSRSISTRARSNPLGVPGGTLTGVKAKPPGSFSGRLHRLHSLRMLAHLFRRIRTPGVTLLAANRLRSSSEPCCCKGRASRAIRQGNTGSSAAGSNFEPASPDQPNIVPSPRSVPRFPSRGLASRLRSGWGRGSSVRRVGS